MHAHYRTLFLRTEASQLVTAMRRIKEIMRPDDHWRGMGHGGILTTGDGRIIEMSGCVDFNDANKKWRGRDHDLKAFDELPLFKKEVYEFVIGWNRTTIPGQRTRVIGAGNPPAKPDEEWVLEYWAPWLLNHTAEPGELVWFAKIEGQDVLVEDGKPFMYKKELIYPRSRTFIPAKLEDNPILEATGYRQTLQNMPEPYRSQLLYGDMSIGRSDDAHQLIPTEWIEASMRKWRERTQHERETNFLTCVGVDASRGGKDRSTIAKRYTNWIDNIISIPGKDVGDGPALATRLMMHLETIGIPIVIDITGTAGGGLYDSLNLMFKNLQTYPFFASKPSEYRDKSGQIVMRNKRTEAYWRLRDALDPHGPNPLILPNSRELKVELAAQRWYMYSGKGGIEDKDEIIKRVGKSPDLADAVAMSMMDGDALSGGWVHENSTHRSIPERFMGGNDPEATPDPRRSNDYNPWG